MAEHIGILDDMLFRQTYEIAGVVEKDPTAYALRSNAATEMHAIGLTEQEIQYCIGHAIDNEYTDRRDFTNEDMLIPIAKKLKFRPIVRAMKRFRNLSELDIVHKFVLQLDTAQHKTEFGNEEFIEIVVPAMENDAEVLLDLTALEPQDAIEISITASQGEAAVELYQRQQKPDYVGRTVNCRSSYYRVYNKYLSQHQKKLFPQIAKRRPSTKYTQKQSKK